VSGRVTNLAIYTLTVVLILQLLPTVSRLISGASWADAVNEDEKQQAKTALVSSYDEIWVATEFANLDTQSDVWLKLTPDMGFMPPSSTTASSFLPIPALGYHIHGQTVKTARSDQPAYGMLSWGWGRSGYLDPLVTKWRVTGHIHAPPAGL